MEPMQHFPARQVLETEDIAADFIENELGRHDWARNWPAYKAKPGLRDRIATWLASAGYQAEPEAVEKAIDQLILTRPGKWR
jgi:hypothetical protein